MFGCRVSHFSHSAPFNSSCQTVTLSWASSMFILLKAAVTADLLAGSRLMVSPQSRIRGTLPCHCYSVAKVRYLAL